ncbi:DUF11 domain-containing protein [Candidatus Peregrinibacteria bacterium]|nr:DUF11 domain-containing protein [Candidatus Peregrinibacteria bacterium]
MVILNAVQVVNGPAAIDVTTVNVPVQTADLSIAKFGPSTAQPGGTIVYALRVHNDGPATAMNVTATDPIPAGLSFIGFFLEGEQSGTYGPLAFPVMDFTGDSGHDGIYGPLPFPPQQFGCAQRDGAVVCTTPSIVSGQTKTALLRFRVSDSVPCNGTIQNSASVSASTPDSNPNNNQSQIVTTSIICPLPIFSITKTDHRDTIQPGDRDTYEITVTNISLFAATAIVTDLFPTQFLDFQSASNGGTLNGSIITWGNLSFQPGEVKTLTVQAQVHANLADRTVIANIAFVSTGPTATDRTTVSAPLQFGCIIVNKEADNPDGNPLSTVPQFTFRLENGQSTQNNASGLATFANVPAGQHTVSEILPQGWTQQQINPAGGIVTVVPGPACANVAIRNRQNPVGTPTFSITKTDNKKTVNPGDFVTYTITVTNTSSIDVGNVAVLDTLPDDQLTFLFSSDNGQLVGPTTVRWIFPSIPAHSTKMLTLFVQVNTGLAAGTSITNTAQVIRGPMTTDTITVNGTQNGCISILKEGFTATGASIATLPPFTFQLENGQTVQNDSTGQATFQNVTLGTHTVTEQSLAGWNPTFVTPSNGVVNVTAGACVGMTFKNQKIAVGTPTFTITKTVNKATAAPGDALTYTITVKNTSSVSGNATVTDAFPTTQLSFQSASDGGTLNGGIITWNNLNFAAGETKTLTVQANVLTSLGNGTIITNTANVGSASSSAVTTVIVNQNPTFTIAKTVHRSTASPGDYLVYTITVTNTSNVTGTATVNDVLPSGLTFVNASDNGVANGQNVAWNNLTVAPGAPKQLTLVATVNSNVANGTILTNTATVTGGANASATTTITVNQNATFSILKTVNRSTASPGDTLVYTLSVTNTSGITGTATVTDIVPTSQVNFITASDGGTLNGQTVTWNNLTVVPGTPKVLALVVMLNASLPNGTVVTNTATVTGGGSSTATTTINVGQSGTFTITKTDNRTTAAPGDTLSYVIAVTNTSSNASPATVTDTLPYGQLTFMSASDNGTVNGQTVTWNNLVIPANSTKIITLTALANSNLVNGTVITNIATVTGGASATDTTTMQTSTNGNVSLTINDYPDPVRPCDTLNYTINVTNYSSQSSLTVTQILSNRTSFIYASDGGSGNNGTITWNNLSVPTGSTKTLTVSVRVLCGSRDGDLLHTTVTAGNTSADATTRVIEDFNNNRNVTLDIRDNPDPVRACDTLDYTLNVGNDSGFNGNNNGFNRQNSVTVRANLDPQTSFVSASGNGFERSRGQVEWGNVFLGNNGTTTLHLTVRVDCGTRDGDTLRLHGQADGATADETTRVFNQHVVPVVLVGPQVGAITVTKQADRLNAAPNDEITYTITVTNTSQASLTGMQVLDSFTPPGQVQLLDAAQVSGGQATWTIDSLAPNQVRTIAYRARVSGAARNGDVLHNSVTVQGGNLPTPGFASADVRVVSSLPQTGGGQFSGPLSLARLFSNSPADQAAASIPLVLWSTIAVLGTVSGGLFGKRFFF